MSEHTHDHGPDEVAQAPQAPQGVRQARPESIIRTMGQELVRVNDNRIFLLSLIDDMQEDLNAVLVENASLKERLEQYEAKAASEPSAEAASNGKAPAKS